MTAAAIAGAALATAGAGVFALGSAAGWELAIAGTGAVIAAVSIAARVAIAARQSAGEARRLAAMSRKQELEAVLAQSRLERARYEEVRAVRAQVETELREAARAAGAPAAGDIDALAEGLFAWQARERERREHAAGARETLARLEALLGGDTREGLAERVRAAQSELERYAEAAGGAIAPEEPLAEIEARAIACRREADAARGAAERAAATLPDPAEADDRAARARAELDRLRALDAVLAKTREFLEQARDATHRDLAPALASALSSQLSRLTGGRYREVRVDPADLSVVVRDEHGEFRDARRLSHGTAEQIYLLLRAALAEHLAPPGERAPLLLDDVTVHCDAERERAVLELLRELSARRQIILFSQVEAVRAWAEARLDPARDRLIRLPPRGGRR